MAFLLSSAAILIVSSAVLFLFSKLDISGKTAYWPIAPENVLHCIIAGYISSRLTLPLWWSILFFAYFIACAATDMAEKIIYRILHYPIIVSGAILLILYGKLYVPVAYGILLAIAAFIHAYKAGDTWLFITSGIFFMTFGLDDMSLLIYWAIAIFVFLIMSVSSIGFVADSASGKKKLKFTEPQPVGPSILYAAFLILLITV